MMVRQPTPLRLLGKDCPLGFFVYDEHMRRPRMAVWHRSLTVQNASLLELVERKRTLVFACQHLGEAPRVYGGHMPTASVWGFDSKASKDACPH